MILDALRASNLDVAASRARRDRSRCSRIEAVMYRIETAALHSERTIATPPRA